MILDKFGPSVVNPLTGPSSTPRFLCITLYFTILESTFWMRRFFQC